VCVCVQQTVIYIYIYRVHVFKDNFPFMIASIVLYLFCCGATGMNLFVLPLTMRFACRPAVTQRTDSYIHAT
jgi:hypothetical protein